MPRVRCLAAWKLSALVASAPSVQLPGPAPKKSVWMPLKEHRPSEGEADTGPLFGRQSCLLILLRHLPEGFFLLLPLSGTWFQSVTALGLGRVFQHPA